MVGSGLSISQECGFPKILKNHIYSNFRSQNLTFKFVKNSKNSVADGHTDTAENIGDFHSQEGEREKLPTKNIKIQRLDTDK